MRISIIAAMADNRVIGNNNQLPWHLSADLKHFKKITMGKAIIMGRKTYTSIGKPLPGRRNIIITRQKNLHLEGCDVVNCIDSALNAAVDSSEAMIIGGANLYQQVLPLANYMYLTLIHKTFEGDAYFPEWDTSQWQETKRQDISDENLDFDYSFVELQRNQGS